MFKRKPVETKETSGGCVEVCSHVPTRAGYHFLRMKDKKEYSHRLSWEYWEGEIPKGMLVCHKCDNPSCINPDHLFLGSIRDNLNDMVMKLRSRAGERNSSRILTENQAREIKRNAILSHKPGVSNTRELAKKYGVNKKTVYAIAKGTRWGWLLD